MSVVTVNFSAISVVVVAALVVVVVVVLALVVSALFNKDSKRRITCAAVGLI